MIQKNAVTAGTLLAIPFCRAFIVFGIAVGERTPSRGVSVTRRRFSNSSNFLQIKFQAVALSYLSNVCSRNFAAWRFSPTRIGPLRTRGALACSRMDQPQLPKSWRVPHVPFVLQQAFDGFGQLAGMHAPPAPPAPPAPTPPAPPRPALEPPLPPALVPPLPPALVPPRPPALVPPRPPAPAPPAALPPKPAVAIGLEPLAPEAPTTPIPLAPPAPANELPAAPPTPPRPPTPGPTGASEPFAHPVASAIDATTSNRAVR